MCSADLKLAPDYLNCTPLTSSASRECLPGITVWLPSQQIHHQHDLLLETAAGKVQRTMPASPHRLHWPDEGIRPHQQGQPVQDSSQDRMSSQTPQHHQVLPWWYEGHRGFWRLHFWILQHTQQCDTGLSVLAPVLSGMLFAMLLNHAFGLSTEVIYLHTRSDVKLFSLFKLREKTKELEVVQGFVYLWSTISDSLSIGIELKKGIAKDATAMSRMSKKSVEQQQPIGPRQSSSLQSICRKHSPVQEWDVDPACKLWAHA